MSVPETTLNGAILSGALALTVRDSLGFAASTEADDVILIDSEFIHVTAGMGTNVWTVTRGYAGSTAAGHADGATVRRIQRYYTDLMRVTTRAEIPDTADNDILLPIIDGVNTEMNRRIGKFIGPSTDTVRVYDGYDVLGGRRLWIKDGIRSLTQVETAPQTGGAYTVGTLTDWMLGPRRGAPGEPYWYVEVIDIPASGYYPLGFGTIRLTGTFGWEEVPADLQETADAWVIRIWKARAGSELGATGGLDPVTVLPFMTRPDDAKLRGYAAMAKSMIG